MARFGSTWWAVVCNRDLGLKPEADNCHRFAVVGSHPNTHNQSRSDDSRKPWVFNPRSFVDTQAPKSRSDGSCLPLRRQAIPRFTSPCDGFRNRSTTPVF
ncbi:hypothetical protein RISK_005499 [Rhodopirellula islandica]|uniref:Uncharacterized protein n=1 Tax=Rhodopirellula islandica TaxID=595434 RepID=A0A0J1B787_RHOIS|nr:hypothetical protein RISK_005499 [Rhodopirellula islandica]